MNTRLARYFEFLAGASLILVAIVAGHTITEHANPINAVQAYILTCTILALGSMFGGGLIIYSFHRER